MKSIQKILDAKIMGASKLKIQRLQQLLDNPTIEVIVEQYADETFLKADGFDDAIIGVDESTMRLIYSVSKCIDILMIDMSEDDAMEYFNFNVSGSYVGDKTPIWCSDYFELTFLKT